MQVNCITQAPYKGENQLKLEAEKENKGFTSDEWLTYLQAKHAGRQVKGGEHGIRLVKITEKENEKGEKVRKARGFTVFNLDQTEVTG